MNFSVFEQACMESWRLASLSECLQDVIEDRQASAQPGSGGLLDPDSDLVLSLAAGIYVTGSHIVELMEREVAQMAVQELSLAACQTLGAESEKAPQRDQFLPNLQAHSPAMDQKAGGKWAAAAVLQPAFPKSDRLLNLYDEIVPAIDLMLKAVAEVSLACETLYQSPFGQEFALPDFALLVRKSTDLRQQIQRRCACSQTGFFTLSSLDQKKNKVR